MGRIPRRVRLAPDDSEDEEKPTGMRTRRSNGIVVKKRRYSPPLSPAQEQFLLMAEDSDDGSHGAERPRRRILDAGHSEEWSHVAERPRRRRKVALESPGGSPPRTSIETRDRSLLVNESGHPSTTNAGLDFLETMDRGFKRRDELERIADEEEYEFHYGLHQHRRFLDDRLGTSEAKKADNTCAECALPGRHHEPRLTADEVAKLEYEWRRKYN